MAKLPYSRVVNVTLTRVDNFPSRRGFGTVLILSDVSKPGQVDATTRTKAYGSMEEVSADWSPSDEAYKAAEAAFSQNPRPIQIKIGFLDTDSGSAPIDASEMKTELDAVASYDNDWYWLTVVKTMRDQDYLDGLIEWTEARPKYSIIASNDPDMQLPNNATNIAARHKNTVERTAIFYHDDANEYPDVAYAAWLGTRNFDQANSAYTGKFKKIRGVAAVNIGSAAVQAITGFVPELGQSNASGHMANTLVDIGGQIFVVEGSSLTQNVFIDEVHATDWIVARTEEESLAVLLNNDRVPYTDAGMEILASAPRTVMRQADRAGLIANDIDPETGAYSPSVEFEIPSVFDVPASQRKARIAPEIAVRFRYAGAVHYTTIHYRMSF